MVHSSSGTQRSRELANGWTYELSTWIEYTIDHKVVEDAGIAPNVVVPRSGNAGVGKRDAVLDRVLQLTSGG